MTHNSQPRKIPCVHAHRVKQQSSGQPTNGCPLEPEYTFLRLSWRNRGHLACGQQGDGHIQPGGSVFRRAHSAIKRSRPEPGQTTHRVQHDGSELIFGSGTSVDSPQGGWSYRADDQRLRKHCGRQDSAQHGNTTPRLATVRESG